MTNVGGDLDLLVSLLLYLDHPSLTESLRQAIETAGPAEPQPGDDHRALWAGSTGDPHAEAADPGLLRLTVDDVLGAVDDVASQAAA